MNVNADSLQQVFERAIKDDEKLKDVDLDDPNVVIAHKDELKKIYQGIGKSKDNVTRINVNSLHRFDIRTEALASNAMWGHARKVDKER